MTSLKPYSFRKLFKNIHEIDTKAIVIPTDTVIGIVAKKPELIYQIKNRPLDKQLVLFINDLSEVKGLLPHEEKILEKYWPGALTVIKNRISYRMPNSKNIMRLIKYSGPLYSSSANTSGGTPIKNTRDAIIEFQSCIYKIMIVKGKERDNYPSTIINLDDLTVLRRGRIDGLQIIEELKRESK
jgi:L-threonylcarbamoyladenylate synthase